MTRRELRALEAARALRESASAITAPSAATPASAGTAALAGRCPAAHSSSATPRPRTRRDAGGSRVYRTATPDAPSSSPSTAEAGPVRETHRTAVPAARLAPATGDAPRTRREAMAAHRAATAASATRSAAVPKAESAVRSTAGSKAAPAVRSTAGSKAAPAVRSANAPKAARKRTASASRGIARSAVRTRSFASRPSVLSRSAVLAALAVTSVGAPVHALLGDNREAADTTVEAVQRVVVAPDGSFETHNLLEGVVAFQRDSITTSRSDRSGDADPEALTSVSVDAGAALEGTLPPAEEVAVSAETAQPEDAESAEAESADAESAEPEAIGADATDTEGAEAESTETDPAAADEAADGEEPAEGAAAAESADPEAAQSEDSPEPAAGRATDAEEDADPAPQGEASEGPGEGAGEGGDGVVGDEGEPTDEGGIPVAPGQPTGSDGPTGSTDLVETEAIEMSPQVAVDSGAEWNTLLYLAEGIGVVSAESNVGRQEVLEEAEALIAETEGILEDESVRDGVIALVEALRGAGTEDDIRAASEELRAATQELAYQKRMASADARMRAAASDARSAIAQGRAYNPSERLDFGMTGWAHPVPGGSFTSSYGPRWGGFHNGIDLAAPSGTPIRVGADGVVTYVGYGHNARGLSGWVVIVSHGNGLETGYNHMYSSGVYVSVGQAVRAGDVIGGVGSTGRSTGPHLHLSVWQNGQHVNPARFWSDRGVSLR